MQKVLVCHTYDNSLRSKIICQEYADTSNLINCFHEQCRAGADYGSIHKFPIDMIRSGECQKYQTIFHALGDSWKLLAPPEHVIDRTDHFRWWLVKE
jgi:hypothetical protein